MAPTAGGLRRRNRATRMAKEQPRVRLLAAVCMSGPRVPDACPPAMAARLAAPWEGTEGPRSKESRSGNRYREVVQRREGLRFHLSGGRGGRVRPLLGHPGRGFQDAGRG